MKVAVTGAAGKLGRVVCRTLRDAGHAVMATDLRDHRDSEFPITVANLLDREGCYRLVEGADALVHLGNYPAEFGRPAAQIYSENVTMNANIFQAALELNVRKWIFSGSVQAMRGTRTIAQNRPSSLAYLPVDGRAPAHPSNTYGLSKVAAEQMLRYYAETQGITAIVGRFPLLLNMDDSPFTKKDFPHPYPYPDEAFAYLDFRDAAILVAAIIHAPLQGYTCYAPAARANLMHRPARELIPEFYAGVPLRKPIHEIDALVDLSDIKRDTGWAPQYE